MAPRIDKWAPVVLVSPDGRQHTLATSKGEEAYLRAQGFAEASDDDEDEAPEPINSGREGNKLAAEASTTKTANDGVDRPATSNA